MLQDGDDTAANFIKFKCDPVFKGHSKEIYVDSGVGQWGGYGLYSNSCDPYHAVCGIQTRVEAYQGSGDDTGLNDVRLFCCEYAL